MANIPTILLAIPLVVLLAGCQQKDVAPATQRAANFQPVYHSEPNTNRSPAAGLNKQAVPLQDIASLHSGRFGASVILSVDHCLNIKEFQKIPWSHTENFLSDWVGNERARISEIKNFSFLINLDLNGLSLSGSQAFPGVLAIEFKKPISPEQVVKKRARTFSRIIGQRFVLLGKRTDVESVHFANHSNADVARRKITHGSFAVGWLDFEQLRPQMRHLFKLMDQMPAANLKNFRSFPDSSERLQFWASTNGNDAFDLQLFLTDQQLSKEIANLFVSVIESAKNINPMATLPGLDMLPPMIDSAAGDSGTKLLREVNERELVRVSGRNQKVHLKMEMAKQMPAFAASLITDILNRHAISVRAQRYRRIALGFKKIERTSEGLESLEKLNSDRADGEPFNWRVAMLPKLGKKSLYDQFDFSKPWDDPDNLKVAASENPFVERNAGVQTTLRWVSDSSGKAFESLRVVDAGTENAVCWIEPVKPLTLNTVSFDTCGDRKENGVLVITDENTLRAVLKGNPAKDVLCPGIQPPLPQLNLGQ